MTMHFAIPGLDAEILAVQYELAAHIDEVLVPLLVRRALARLALGPNVLPPAPIVAGTPSPDRLWPETNHRPGGAPGRILDLLHSAPGGSLSSLEINAAFPDLKQDTVLKSKSRLVNHGYVTKDHGRYTLAPRGEAVFRPVAAGDAALGPSKPTREGSHQSVVLRIVEAGPPEGVTIAGIDEAAALTGMTPHQARCARYNLKARGLLVHDTRMRTWRRA